MMKFTKVAAAVALSTGLLAGCNTDLRDSTDSGETPTTPESSLQGGYWEFSEYAAFASADEADLPNVYVFEGTTQKYYNDDDNYGTYTLYSSISTIVGDVDAGTITFTYYGNSSDLKDTTEVTGDYVVTNGVLTISESNLGELTATDNSEDTAVTEAVTAANKESGVNGYVQILDTSTDDTGELRIKLVDSTTTAVEQIESGRLTVDLVYQIDEDSIIEPTNNNAYISFYAAKTSNSNLHGEVAFGDGVIKYRDSTGTLADVGRFELGEILAVEVTWGPDSFSFSVNDIEYAINVPVADGTAVTYIALRLGDNSSTTHFELLGDNLVVYSNDSGEEVSVLEEDFDSYSSGTDLSTVYNSSTNEAFVYTKGGSTDPEEPTDPSEVTDNFDSYIAGTQIDEANSSYVVSGVDGTTTIAAISEKEAKSGTNSLYVFDKSTEGKGVVSRAFTDGAAETGSVSTSVYIPADGYIKSTYLYLGTSESGASNGRFTEVVFSSSEVKFRNESGSQIAIADYAQDTWVDVTMSWALAADGTTYDVTINVDGIDYTTYEEDGSTFYLKAENAGKPTLFALYNGDKSSVGTYTYFDDLDSDLFE